LQNQARRALIGPVSVGVVDPVDCVDALVRAGGWQQARYRE
jgi:hypothetical protein